MKHKLRDNSFGVTCPCGKIVISLVIDVTIKNHFQTLVDPNRYFAEEPNDTYEIIVENK